MFNKTKGKMLPAVAIALSLVMTAPVLVPQVSVVAEAATKTSAWLYDNGIGVNDTTKIVLDGKKKNASYSYSSSKKSVATVSKSGVVKGVKTGTANITVYQKYKGKTSKVKTFKVSVKQAKIYKDYQSKENAWVFSAQPGWISKTNPVNLGKAAICVNYQNPKAKYTFSSDSPNLVVSNGKVVGVKKAGTANLVIKETYKGKTRVVGKIPAELKEPYYTGEDTIQLYIGEKFKPSGDAQIEDEKRLLELLGKYGIDISEKQESDEDILKNANSSDTEVGENNGPVKFEFDSANKWTGKLIAQSEGTVYCTIAEWNYLENKYDKVIAHFKIAVSDASKLTDLQLPWEREKVREDEDELGDTFTYDKAANTINASLYANSYDDEEPGGIALYMKQVQNVYYGDYKVTSSDKKVVSASVDRDPDSYGSTASSSADFYNPLYEWPENRHEGGMYLNLAFNKVGKATITVEAGGVKKSFTVNVTKEDLDDDWDEDLDE